MLTLEEGPGKYNTSDLFKGTPVTFGGWEINIIYLRRGVHIHDLMGKRVDVTPGHSNSFPRR